MPFIYSRQRWYDATKYKPQSPDTLCVVTVNPGDGSGSEKVHESLCYCEFGHWWAINGADSHAIYPLRFMCIYGHELRPVPQKRR